MFRKTILLILSVLIITPVLASSSEVTSLINTASEFGLSYEKGDITYTQLLIQLNFIQQKVNQVTGTKDIEIEEEKGFQAMTVETLENLFGPPNQKTDRVWVINKEQDVRLEERVPRWEKIIYSGEQIKLVFEANPIMIIDSNNEKKLFYHTQINVWFKKQYSFNVDSMISEVKSSFENFYLNGQDPSTTAQLMAQNSQTLSNYLEDNRENCVQTLKDLFPDAEIYQESVSEWKGTMKQAGDLWIILRVNLCGECEWKNIRFELEPRIDRKIDFPEMQKDRPDFKIYEEKTVEELWTELENLLTSLKNFQGNEEQTLQKMFETQDKLWMINDMIDRKTNDNKDFDEREQNFNERESRARNLFEKFVENPEYNSVTRTIAEKEIFAESETHYNTWCQSKETQCADKEYCSPETLTCVSAIGGNEICDNGMDDDGDSYWDCDDPDCEDCSIKVEGEFYCGENAQPTENGCECNEGFYNCDEGGDCESTTPCGQKTCSETGCLENAYCSTEGECKCIEGRYDCDHDGTCESTDSTCFKKTCKDFEDCDNGFDDDCDFLIDWEDPDCSQSKEIIKTVVYEPEGNATQEQNKVTINGTGGEGNVTIEGTKEENQTIVENGTQGQTENVVVTQGENATSEENVVVEETVSEENQSTGENVVVEVAAEEENNETTTQEESLNIITGGVVFVQNFFSTITGMITSVSTTSCESPDDCSEGETCNWEFKTCTTKCETDSDCSQGMRCDDMEGTCRCKKWEGHFDCDNNYDNGCESNDVTCGGTVDSCADRECTMPNQQCDPKMGECNCVEGFYDCNGDWLDGCESTSECGEKMCETDSDCPSPRCDWRRMVTFECKQSDGWTEEKAKLLLRAECSSMSNGDKWAGAFFDAWGSDPKLGELQKIRDQEMMKSMKDWCQIELDNLLKERKELEKDFNDEFVQWFLNEYVSGSLDDWDKHMRGFGELYGRLMGNTERIAHTTTECLEEDSWPEGFNLITAEGSNEFGSIKVWEEWKSTTAFGEELTVPHAYMQVWIFPTKEMIKQEFKKNFDQELGEGMVEGPTYEEREEIRNNEEVYNVIKSISNSFGGEANIGLKLVDGNETMAQVVMKINPDIIMEVKKMTVEDSPDATISIEFDFLYNIIETQTKEVEGVRTETPHWEEQKGGFGGPQDGPGPAVMIKILGSMLNGILTGKVRVEPPTQFFRIIASLQSIISLMSQIG